jgi:hypothetical protein
MVCPHPPCRHPRQRGTKILSSLGGGGTVGDGGVLKFGKNIIFMIL